MISRQLANALLLAALALPGPALGRSWQGVTPGVTTQAEVVARFGEPSTKGKLEGKTALVYKGDQAISGTRQAQFFLGEDGVVTEINVFPATQLDKDSVAGTYGKDPQKTFTDDFRPVWIYRPIGVMVFFGKEGQVEAIRFRASERSGEAGAPLPAKAQPPRAAAAPPAPRPGE
ncbi:MAG TPA: hypothetical protein VMK42_03220 [Anaeromyxobacteraceae bacterium]|nr:hypothetical protein [Anaeromyxobacteraceae bacterium]